MEDKSSMLSAAKVKNKLSVIIPFYNSDKYIRQCIESVLNQSYRNIEVLLINNGSTDDSLNISQEYAISDSRIHIITENKAGAAAARNCGIAHAMGEFVTFVDSDDYVDENMYCRLMELIDKYEADIACCSFNYVYSDGTPTGWYEPQLEKYIKDSQVVSGVEAGRIFLTSRDLEGFCWNKIFRSSVIKENFLRFDEAKKSFEDMQFVFDGLIKSGRVVLCDQKLYYYRQIGFSLTRDISPERSREFFDTLEKVGDKALACNLGKEAINYKVVKSVYHGYDRIKGNRQKRQMRILPSDVNILMAIHYILIYQKTEKLKTLVKLGYCLIHKAGD